MANFKSGLAGKILAGALGIFCVASVTLIFVLRNENDYFAESAVLEIEGAETKTLSFETLSLLPGESRDFYINFTSKNIEKYNISLDFNKTGDSGLDEYVFVEIKARDFEYTNSLSNLFNNDEVVSFDLNFTKPSKERICLNYSIPSEVGNEAQGKFIDFDVVLNISK